MTRLTLFTRPGCHLCDDMKAVVEQIQHIHAVALDEVDISGQTELERRYGTEIPVLTHEARIVARIRTSPAELLEVLREIRR